MSLPDPDTATPSPTAGGHRRADVAAAVHDEAARSTELYESAPCGLLSTLPDGTVVRANATLLGWLGRTDGEVVGRSRFADLLTVGGRIHYETHIAPLLAMQGAVRGFALELRTTGGRLPVLVSATVSDAASDEPEPEPAGHRVRFVVFEARDRRSYEAELLQARREADRERERIQRLATVLQQTLLPPRLPEVPGVATAAYYHPASVDEVGGDFYDLFPLPGVGWGFFLGDVCGKGATAAALTSLARYTLRSAAAHDPEPVAVLTNLDAVLAQEHDRGNPKLCTAVHGVLRTEGDGVAVTLASGGHPPPLVLRADGAVDVLDLVGGHILGAVPEPRFARTDLRLGPGDTLLLYTDGLIEARVDDDGTRYDEDDLLRFARALAPAPPAATVEAVTALLEGFGDGLDDDVALLALGPDARERAAR